MFSDRAVSKRRRHWIRVVFSSAHGEWRSAEPIGLSISEDWNCRSPRNDPDRSAAGFSCEYSWRTVTAPGSGAI